MTLATVVRVIDGDTVEVAFTRPVRIRIADVDAPEKGTTAGDAALAYLAALLPVDSTVDVRIRTEDPHGRPVAWVAVNVGERMVETGNARRWTS